MKTIKRIVMMVALLLTVVCTQAQDQRQRLSREQMAETQAKHIASDLALSDAVYNRFVTTYVSYKKELWAIAPRRDKKKQHGGDTEEQAGENIRQRMERSQKMLDIRDKYYKEFSKFLTQKQIELMYEKERKIMQRLSKRHDANRKGNGRQRR